MPGQNLESGALLSPVVRLTSGIVPEPRTSSFHQTANLLLQHAGQPATSPALRVVDTTNRRERYVIDGVLERSSAPGTVMSYLLGAGNTTVRELTIRIPLFPRRGRFCEQLAKRTIRSSGVTCSPGHSLLSFRNPISRTDLLVEKDFKRAAKLRQNEPSLKVVV